MLLHTYPGTARLLQGHSYPHGHSLNHQGPNLRHWQPKSNTARIQAVDRPQTSANRTPSSTQEPRPKTVANWNPPQEQRNSSARKPFSFQPGLAFGEECHPVFQSSPVFVSSEHCLQQHIALQQGRNSYEKTQRLPSVVYPSATGHWNAHTTAHYQPKIYSENLIGESFTKMAMRASQMRSQPFRSANYAGGHYSP